LNERYIELRSKARKVPDFGRYSLKLAQMNPMIFEFILSGMDGLPKTIWEPFSAPSSDIFRFMASMRKFKMDSYGLVDVPGVHVCDSKYVIPAADYGCVLFHPPYYGSDLQSGDLEDLSRLEVWEEYKDAVSKAMTNAAEVLVDNGMLVLVGRDYRAMSKRVRLDLMYLDIMEGLPLKLEEVWISEPDVVLVARKGL